MSGWVKRVLSVSRSLAAEYVDQPTIFTGAGRTRRCGTRENTSVVRRCVGSSVPRKEGHHPHNPPKLLRKRKETRAKIKTETDEFKKAVLDGQQLSFKLTANSCYGAKRRNNQPNLYERHGGIHHIGWPQSPLSAQEKTLEKFPGSEIVYGDTDSIFINFNPKDAGNTLTGKEGLQKSIDLGIAAEKHIQQFLKKPHKLNMKRHFIRSFSFQRSDIGYKYEEDVNKYKETSGVALKRRDNAKIVKHIYKNVLDALLKDQDIKKAVSVLNRDLQSLIDGKFPLNMLTITKSSVGFMLTR